MNFFLENKNNDENHAPMIKSKLLRALHAKSNLPSTHIKYVSFGSLSTCTNRMDTAIC